MHSLFSSTRSVEDVPGYQSNSPYEEEAPGTPTAASGSEASTSVPPPKLTDLPPRTSSSNDEVSAAASSPQPFADLPPTLPPRTNPPTPKQSNDSETYRSPGARQSTATVLPYNFPSPVSSPPVPMPQPSVMTASQVTEPEPSTSKNSKFAGLKLKGWPSKNSAKDKDKDREPSPKSPKDFSPQSSFSLPPGSATPEPAKSPLGGLRGLKFWQKDDNKENHETIQSQCNAFHPSEPSSDCYLPSSGLAASDMSSPATSAQGVDGLPKPMAPALSSPSVGRIPRKSSLASLNATHRSESLSPNHALQQGPFAAAKAGSPSQGAYPSPPTHTSLPSPQPRSAPLPPLPPVGATTHLSSEEHIIPQDTPPLLIRGDSSTTSATSAGVSPQFFPSTTANLTASESAPGLNIHHKNTYPDAYISSAPLDRTPELGSSSSGRFFGQHGQVSSAPVTPAYSEPSVVSSSGRLGKPMKANPAKANFRLS